MTNESVILVDENDHEIGICDKLKAHQTGQLHRAISVFIFNDKKQMLLQRRASTKYHSGGLWTNACCSHPRPGESAEKAAGRRLTEEMRIACHPLHFAFTFIYKAALDNKLTEHELDHVFIGQSNQQPNPDPEEVSEWKYLSVTEITKILNDHPEQFTYWFRLIFGRVIASYFSAN